MLAAALRTAGFTSARLLHAFGAARMSDIRYLLDRAPPPHNRLCALIGLLVAGRRVLRASLPPELWSAIADVATLDETADGVRVDASLLPAEDAYLVADRFDATDGEAVAQPDLSALNVIGCLPRAGAGATLYDVGCSAGAIAIVAAQRGFRARGSDIHARAIEFARKNARLDGVDVEFAVADLFGTDATRSDFVAFNAPLLQAAMAHGAGDAARYETTPEGAALAERFVAALPARLADGGEALLHAQLVPAVEAALTRLADAHRVASIVFAHAPDGTPHALTSIRPGTGRRVAFVPLSPLVPHLRRDMLDAIAADAAADVPVVPAPWLELRESRQYGGAWQEAAFGGVRISAEERAVLDAAAAGEHPSGAVADRLRDRAWLVPAAAARAAAAR